MSQRLFTKDKDAILDYGIDWTRWLDGDTITDSVWTLDSDDIEVESENFTPTQTVVFLSGGAVDAMYALTNHITTANAREDDRTIYIKIVEK